MTPPKKVQPELFSGPFDEFVWHYKVREHLGEKLRYFLVSLKPYDPLKLSASLRQLVADKCIGGLRVYRIYGQYDLMMRAWMDERAYHNMEKWVSEYIGKDAVKVEISSTYIRDIEHRWYGDDSSEQTPQGLIDALDHKLVKRIESGRDEDKEIFNRYSSNGLIFSKPRTDNAITFFLCIKFPSDRIERPDRARLVSDIKDFLSEHHETYLYPEIDRASGELSGLMVRARTTKYFEVGNLVKWVGKRSHVSNTETYLSIEIYPVFGNTTLSLATFDAREPRSPDVLRILPDFYPKRQWNLEHIANEVELFLLSHRTPIPSAGLTRFLNIFLSGVLQGPESDEGKAVMASACLRVFPPLESYLRDYQGRYFSALGEDVGDVYKECFWSKEEAQGQTGKGQEIQPKPRGPEKAGLAQLLHTYNKVISKKERNVDVVANFKEFTEVRNQQFHLKEGVWKEAANILINNWPMIQSLLSEIDKTCGTPAKRPPEIFAK